MTTDRHEDLKLKFMSMAKQFNWKIPNINTNTMDVNDIDVDESKSVSSVSNNIQSYSISTPEARRVCPICGVSISSFLLDNHKRHCIIHHNNHKTEQPSIISASPSSSETSHHQYQSLIACKYCEYECNQQTITSHELYCGSRTDICSKCGERDTIQQLKENKHLCDMQQGIIDLCSSEDDMDMDHNTNRNGAHSTPILIREERQRMEIQQQMDHDLAMNLAQTMIEQQQFNNNAISSVDPFLQFDLEHLNMSNIDDLSYDDLNDLFPNIAEGATEETIRRLPTDIFHKTDKMSNDKHKCCICLEQFKNGEEIRRLQCLHIFHKQEIDQWLRQNKVCPICRIDVQQHI